MNLPNLPDVVSASEGAWPYLVSGGVVLALALAWTAYLIRRPTRTDTRPKMTLENRLTFLVAIIIAGVCAQGMGRFFYKELGFPIELVIVVGGVLELTAFTCALRARRNILDPNIGKAGVDGIAVWVVTAMSGMFSAMETNKAEVAVFRLVMPLLAAWLWERGMSIERRKVRGGSNIHMRVTPERVLVWLRIAEPSGRTASEVDAHRRITRVAKAAAKVRSLKAADSQAWRQRRAEKKLERATLAAVVHAKLGTDPERKDALVAQVRFIFNALSLSDVAPDSPWVILGDPSGPGQGDLTKVTGSPSGQRALPSPSGGQVTAQASDPKPGQVTPESLPQATPRNGDRVTDTVTPPVAQGTRPKAPVRSPSPRQTRTDEELIADLNKIVAEHYRQHPGEEIKVKPLAKQLGIGRDRARRLLDEMNVRPIRKAVGQ